MIQFRNGHVNNQNEDYSKEIITYSSLENNIFIIFRFRIIRFG